ncbi:uncharacterized protein [Euwallacea fornicatus]|uniref:uncharacterized protein n=1 Tax=Euwallacea fornicatus TaxID=995702 RepID=UPI00338F806C
MTKLNVKHLASSAKADSLSEENKNLLTRVQQLELSLTNGLAELKSELLGNEETATPPANLDDCVRRITSFEHRALKEISEVRTEILNTDQKLSDLKQELLLNNLVVHGMKENRDTVYRAQNEFCDMVKRNMGIHITPGDIDFCYRMGPPQDNRSRPLVVAFVNRWIRNDIFNSKRLLKGTGMLVFENLIYERLVLFRKVRALVGVKNCWTRRGKIFVALDGEKKQITDINELESE